MLEDIDYDFNGFDTTFSKNLFGFLKLSLTAVFSLILVAWNFTVQWPGFIVFSWKNRWDNNLILVESW